MFWVDRLTADIQKQLKSAIDSGTELIVRDEKTASGRIHIGSMRGVAIHGAVTDALKKTGIPARFLFEINDFDPMDGLPVYLDEKEYRQHMGKPLCNIPSPEKGAENFAEYFARDFIDVIKDAGFHVDEFPRASELYRAGKMNDVIRLALEKAERIRQIYKEISGSVKDDDWLPLSVICESCGKIGTTKAMAFDGEKVTYTCEKDVVSWAEGCGHEGTISPFDGNGKLPWKVEWAAKFKVYNVHIEGAGKDHSTKGGSRDIANHIAREVYDYKPPFDIPYEFFLIGGKKMSSSKGKGSSSREIADLVPKNIFRLALLGRDPKRTVEFTPDGDTIPLLFDWHDRLAEKYFENVNDDDTRLFEEIYGNDKIMGRFLPRFSQVAFLSQIPSIDIVEQVTDMKGEALTSEDKEELDTRLRYAQNWIEQFAPESYLCTVQDTVPEEARSFDKKQKETLKKILEYIQSVKKLNGQELHTKLHDIRAETGIEPKDLFSALYISIIGKESGPKAGWFLSVLDKGFLEKRLEEVSS